MRIWITGAIFGCVVSFVYLCSKVSVVLDVEPRGLSNGGI